MKVRQGFVSNSSSSSFIITTPGTTTIEIAKAMIACKENNASALGNKFDHLIKNNPSVSHIIPIRFRSINYDTYIWSAGSDNQLHISTCNNEDWSDALDGHSLNYKDEEESHDDNLYYWFLEYDILCRDISWEERRDKKELELCKIHFEYPLYIFDESIISCPTCYKGHTFTQQNNKPPIKYNGPNIRRYQYTRSF